MRNLPFLRRNLSRPLQTAATFTASAALLAAAVLPAACNQMPQMKSSGDPGILSLLMQNTSLNVSVSGLMTFYDHGQNVTSFTEFAVHDVPITWIDTTNSVDTAGTMNTTFTGNVTSYPAPGEVIIDHVHGVAQENGRILEHIAFWREIHQEGKPDTYFDVTVYAIPIDGTGNSTLATSFSQTGNIKPHVIELDYIGDNVTLVGTDWTNAAQPPVLNVRFGK